MNIYIVTIDRKQHYVRAPSKREATRIAVDHVSEDTRMASHDDLMKVFKHGHTIIGFAEPESDTQDLPLKHREVTGHE